MALSPKGLGAVCKFQFDTAMKILSSLDLNQEWSIFSPAKARVYSSSYFDGTPPSVTTSPDSGASSPRLSCTTD